MLHQKPQNVTKSGTNVNDNESLAIDDKDQAHRPSMGTIGYTNILTCSIVETGQRSDIEFLIYKTKGLHHMCHQKTKDKEVWHFMIVCVQNSSKKKIQHEMQVCKTGKHVDEAATKWCPVEFYADDMPSGWNIAKGEIKEAKTAPLKVAGWRTLHTG